MSQPLQLTAQEAKVLALSFKCHREKVSTDWEKLGRLSGYNLTLNINEKLDTAAGIGEAAKGKATSVTGASKRKHVEDEDDEDDEPAVPIKRTFRGKRAASKKSQVTVKDEDVEDDGDNVT
ncbi:hypothetical protein PG994_008783 [Apiospora phragmitis]|uniref:Uncharacterized protein n=1 Tax=Apiospora phragmitis TaxID=2905665 RepID=A0ABR1UHF8_9PEZI